MRVWINEQALEVIPGMTVRQALQQAGLDSEIEKGAKVFDPWGNEVGLEGALSEGVHYSVRF